MLQNVNLPKEYQEICFPEWDNVAFGRKEG